MEEWLVEQRGSSVDAAEAQATQYVALTQVMMANSITSLRALGHMDWQEFVETQSALDAVLRRDPSGVYERMTFATRDRYRHVVERVSKRVGLEEARVAQIAVDLRQPLAQPRDAVARARVLRRAQHVGAEPHAIVGDAHGEPAVRDVEADLGAARPGMADDVADELTLRAHQRAVDAVLQQQRIVVGGAEAPVELHARAGGIDRRGLHGHHGHHGKCLLFHGHDHHVQTRSHCRWLLHQQTGSRRESQHHHGR